MKYDTVVVKQIPDDYSVATGLSKYGRSRMPMTYETFQAMEGVDGRAITGIDEDAWAVNSISDPEEREKIKEQKKTLRESLEKATGKDLNALSDFWDTFTVSISADQDLVLNKANPIHVIRYHLLVSNGYVAPDKDSTGHPEFLTARYYCHVDERANKEEVSTQKTRDRARAKLLEISASHDTMVMIGQYLEGDKYKSGMSDDTLYAMLSAYIEDKKEPENLKKFVKAATANIEEIQFKITIDRAFKKKVIRVRDGYYQRGQVTLGKSITEVYNNLQTPEFATEFLSIREEVG
jgi:hypothetical protein